jgi:hypothetical protein
MLLAVLMVAGASMAAHAQQKSKNPLAEIGKSPLTFYIAQGDENACGPGCNEWIAAEGFFDAGSPARFRKIIATKGASKLPVFFESGGGLQNAAEAIGGIMRESGMIAGVAKTIPEECAPSAKDTRACAAVKKSGKKITAHWSSVGATCNSACVYALVGARERRVPFGSLLGVHAVLTICRGPEGLVDARDPRCKQFQSAAKSRIAKYVSKMGVDAKLVEAAEQIPHEKVRVLTREEISRFGIDRSAFRQSPWMIGLSEKPVIVKFVDGVKAPDGAAPQGIIILHCHSNDYLAIRFFRPGLRNDAVNDFVVAAIVGGRRIDMGKGVVSKFEFIDPAVTYEYRDSWIPMALVDPNFFDLKIEISELSSAVSPAKIVLEPSGDGFHRAWKALPACPTGDGKPSITGTVPTVPTYNPAGPEIKWNDGIRFVTPR